MRSHFGPETVTLANYRQRYAQYKTDPDLQAAHAAAPWLVVFDDHEVQDNWADEIPSGTAAGISGPACGGVAGVLREHAVAPSRHAARHDMQLYRRVHWGTLATFHMLDTRQYRDDQACGDDGPSDCAERRDPSRSLMGQEQERWLLNGFQQSQARWDLLGQQVFFSQIDLTPGPGADSIRTPGTATPATGTASWPAWSIRRCETPWCSPATSIRTGRPRCTRTPTTPHPVVATELVTTSISSGGDGSDTRARTRRCCPKTRTSASTTTAEAMSARRSRPELRADFRVVPYVSRPGAKVRTAASFTVPDSDAVLLST